MMRRFWVWLAVQLFESGLPPDDPDWEHPPKSTEEIVREQISEWRRAAASSASAESANVVLLQCASELEAALAA